MSKELKDLVTFSPMPIIEVSFTIPILSRKGRKLARYLRKWDRETRAWERKHV